MPIFFSLSIYLFIFWLYGMSDLSSLRRDETSAPGSRSGVPTTGPPENALQVF